VQSRTRQRLDTRRRDTELQLLNPSSLMRLAAHDHRHRAGSCVSRHFLPSSPGTFPQSALPSPDLRKARVAQSFACVRHRSGMARSAHRTHARSKFATSLIRLLFVHYFGVQNLQILGSGMSQCGGSQPGHTGCSAAVGNFVRTRHHNDVKGLVA
jgi:hypothetical protein